MLLKVDLEIYMKFLYEDLTIHRRISKEINEEIEAIPRKCIEKYLKNNPSDF